MSLETSIWPGAVLWIILVSAFLTAVISSLLLHRYRRETLQAMNRLAGALPVPPRLPRPAVPEAEPLRILRHEAANAENGSPTSEAAWHRMRRSLRGLGWIYATGVLVYAAALAGAWVAVAGHSPLRTALLWVSFAWPLVLAVGLVATTDGKERLGIAGLYAAIWGALAFLVLSRSPESSFPELMFLWLLLNAPATILLFSFARSGVRAVGPLVLAFVTLGVTGSTVAFDLLRRSGDAVLRPLAAAAASLGLDAWAVLAMVEGLGFAVMALVGWAWWKRLGRRYEAKRFSDLSLRVDAMLLCFAVVHPLLLLNEGWIWGLTGLAGFLGYLVVTRVGFRVLRAAVPAGSAPKLLFLRVFALGRESERFFDRFSTWWLRHGSIRLIAGPDLVTRTVSPRQFLDFVSGRHRQRFVTSPGDAVERIRTQDTLPDPDGRYRVTEFFCHADTWQTAVRLLAQDSDAVLMDLRGFSPAHQGCRWEIGQLLDAVPLDRVVLLVDDSTQETFLHDTLRHLWRTVDPASPNFARPHPEVHLFHLHRPDRTTLRALLRRLTRERLSLL